MVNIDDNRLVLIFLKEVLYSPLDGVRLRVAKVVIRHCLQNCGKNRVYCHITLPQSLSLPLESASFVLIPSGLPGKTINKSLLEYHYLGVFFADISIYIQRQIITRGSLA